MKPVFVIAPTPEDQAAARLFPRAKPGQPPPPPAPAAGSTAPQPALPGYYAIEARNFADGTHSVLDVRNAISAEFGPVPLAKVLEYFRELETAGSWTVESR